MKSLDKILLQKIRAEKFFGTPGSTWPEKVLSIPKVPNIYVNWRNLKTFWLKKKQQFWSNTCGSFF